jgi:SAM-dependent methyltransferase
VVSDTDRQLAGRYGRYASFTRETDPVSEYYGDSPWEEVDRLLDAYAAAESCVLDVGCGAGQTIGRIAPSVAEVWGVDMWRELLDGARLRAEELGFANVTFIEGDASLPATTDQLPDDHFDLALSRRGPDFNALLAAKLKMDAVAIQERVGVLTWYPLREMLGRTNYAPYDHNAREVLLHRYAEFGLFPVSVKEYLYDDFYRDFDHLEAEVLRTPACLMNWRVGTPRPYEPERDRAALELFARYNQTPRGIRVLQHRLLFTFRKTTIAYYPVDGCSGDVSEAGE